MTSMLFELFKNLYIGVNKKLNLVTRISFFDTYI